jgi:hypothetical protein
MVGFWLTGFCPGHLVEAIALVPINRYVDIIILPEVVDGTVVVVASLLAEIERIIGIYGQFWLIFLPLTKYYI